MTREWIIAPADDRAPALAQALNLSTIAAQILINRGVADADAARQFLKPKFADLHAPDRLYGAVDAADRIVAAIRDQRRIVIYGDYDVDGITGTAILWHCIRLAGAEPEYYIPHRLEEGYGLNPDAIEKLAADGAHMIITVDCGITAIEPALAARRAGVELIITDHHQSARDAAGDIVLPDAAAIVHAGLGDDPVNPDLSGAGVALKLAWMIALRLSNSDRVTPEFREFLLTATGLAALGLIADVVPLVGENRTLALHGLRGLPGVRQHGVRALIESAGLTGAKLSGYDIGFKLAPRLNAIGRMGHARLAVELFTRASADDARRIATNLEQHNRQRQALERRIRNEARDMVIDRKLDSDASRAIVLAHDNWHSGVVGIVASRLVDEFHRPAVMIATNGDGVGQGSARSIANFPLYEALRECSDHLLTFGGHAMAAGLRIETAKCEAFAEAFGRRAAQRLTHNDLQPRLRIDAVAGLDELSEGLLHELGHMEPFGAGNPAPRLATDWLAVIGRPRKVGANSAHLQLVLGQNGVHRKAVAFGMADEYHDRLCDARRCRIAFKPILNEWNGRRSVEMQVTDIQIC